MLSPTGQVNGGVRQEKAPSAWGALRSVAGRSNSRPTSHTESESTALLAALRAERRLGVAEEGGATSVQLPVPSGEPPRLRGGERAPVEAVELHRLLAHRPVDVTAASLPADGAPAAPFPASRPGDAFTHRRGPRPPAPEPSGPHEQDSGVGHDRHGKTR